MTDTLVEATLSAWQKLDEYETCVRKISTKPGNANTGAAVFWLPEYWYRLAFYAARLAISGDMRSGAQPRPVRIQETHTDAPAATWARSTTWSPAAPILAVN
jgi:hypothetical protein